MVDVLRIRVEPFGTEEYRATVRLRDRVLRAPLGLAFAPEQLAAETNDLHLAAYLGGELAACLVLTPRAADTIQMRQVAVSETVQKQGVGSALVRRSEEFAREYGFRVMILHARETAVRFYLRLGYEVFGDPFEEVTLPHRSMRKDLG